MSCFLAQKLAQTTLTFVNLYKRHILQKHIRFSNNCTQSHLSLSPTTSSAIHILSRHSLMSPSSKRKMIQIATHSGTFHADEALACAMLRLLPEYQNAQIIRTRAKSEIDSSDIVVDVGGVYDAEKLRFDHHQASFQDTMNTLHPTKPWQVRLSTAGLVYNHFGRKIIQHLQMHPEICAEMHGNGSGNITKTGSDERQPLDEQTLERVFDKVYKNFIIEIDAIDNGIEPYDVKEEPRYSIHTCLSSRVSALNPNWLEKCDAESLYERFLKAVELTGCEFIAIVRRYLDCWLAGRAIVKQALLNRFKVDASGEIMEFDRDQLVPPWKQDVFEFEKELKLDDSESPNIKYCIFYDLADNSYRIAAMPIYPSSFVLRIPLPEAWRGYRNDELDKLVGCSDCIFVHATGFIGGAKTRQAAIFMAKKALFIAQSQQSLKLAHEQQKEMKKTES